MHSYQGFNEFLLNQNKLVIHDAWKTPYQGDAHLVLLNNINCRDRGVPYLNLVPVVQSSGTGKSRMVHQLSTLVFTIPFNLRNEKESRLAAYPDPDSSIRRVLLNPSIGKRSLPVYYMTFLSRLFSAVLEKVKEIRSQVHQQMSYQDYSEKWHQYMESNRTAFYQEVKEATADQSAIWNHEGLTDIEAVTRVAKDELEALIAVLPTSPAETDSDAQTTRERLHEADGTQKAGVNLGNVKILLYFDSADVLCDTSETESMYTVLCSCLARFAQDFPTMVAVFLSSDIQIAQVTHSHSVSLPPPVTGVAFDIADDLNISQNQLSLKDVSNVVFMAKFGRPLWWTAIRAARKHTTLDDMGRQLIELTRVKLFLHHNIDMDLSRYNGHQIHPWGLAAVVDVRLQFEYAVSHEAFDAQTGQIDRHMRMAYSFPRHREYVYSGYPSEPLVAEAAAQQMWVMRQRDMYAVRDCLYNVVVGDQLVSPGGNGELVGRYLLTMAYDRAIEKEQFRPRSIAGPPFFSRGCSFENSVTELFTEEYAEQVLNSRPDNIGQNEGVSLREAFQDAKIRFTHWVQTEGDEALTSDAAYAGLVRGMAFITGRDENRVDAIIPIHYTDEKLSTWSTTALMIRIRRRPKGLWRIQQEIRAEDYGFFPDGGEDRARAPPLPYVTLIMELGAQPSVKGWGHRSEDTDGPVHHRYSIFAYGCSGTVYKVINETKTKETPESDNEILARILASHDPIEEFPWSNPELVGVRRSMKPYFAQGPDSFHWLDVAVLNKAAEVADEDHVLVGSSISDVSAIGS